MQVYVISKNTARATQKHFAGHGLDAPVKPNQELGILSKFVRKFYTKRNLNLQLRIFQHKQLPLESEIESVLLPRKVLE